MSEMALVSIICALIASLTVIVVAVLTFFLRREREFGKIQASLKAEHQRIDKVEKKLNGVQHDQRR